MTVKSIRMVVLDLDETTLDAEGRIPELTKEVLRKLHNRGVIIVFATGRPWRRVWHLTVDLPIHAAVCSNGVKIICPKREVFLRHLVHEPQVHRVVVEYGRDQGLSLIATSYLPGDPRGKVVHREAPLCDRGVDVTRRFLLPDPIEVDDLLTLSPPSRILFFDEYERMEGHVREIRRRLGDQTGEIPIPFFVFGTGEVLPRGATKAHAILEIASELGIDPAHMMACGDSNNDQEMLELVGLAVVSDHPRTTKPHIRALANLTFGWDDGNGLPRFLTEFFSL